MKPISLVALLIMMLLLCALTSCTLNQNVSAQPTFIEENLHQQILNATVQIKLIAPLIDEIGNPVIMPSNGVWHKQNAVVNGLGTLVKIDGQTMIVTHDHWGDLLLQAEVVEFKDANGVLIAVISGIIFRNLIRYRDGGTLLLQAPQGLTAIFGNAVEKGDGNAMLAGSDVFLTRHQAGNQHVEVVLAQVTAVSNSTNIPTINLLSLDGSPVIKGDSGGGVWSDDKLVGNMWWTIVEETSFERHETDFSGAATYTESIQESLQTPQPDMLSGGGERQSP